MQNELEKMSSVIVAQKGEIDELRRSISALERRLNNLQVGPDAEISPE